MMRPAQPYAPTRRSQRTTDTTTSRTTPKPILTTDVALAGWIRRRASNMGRIASTVDACYGPPQIAGSRGQAWRTTALLAGVWLLIWFRAVASQLVHRSLAEGPRALGLARTYCRPTLSPAKVKHLAGSARA